MLTKLYKSLIDISVCYTVGAVLLFGFADIMLYSGDYFILLLTVLISTLLDRKGRYKVSAVFFIPFSYLVLFKPDIPGLIVFMLTWAYYSYVLITGRFIITRGEFVDRMKHFFYLFLSLILVMLTAKHSINQVIQAACPYLITIIVSAVFLLRDLRVDHQLKRLKSMEQMKQYRNQQIIELLVFLIICLLLTLIRVPQNLALGMKLMYQHLLAPILSLLVGIISMLIVGIIYLITAAGSLLINKKGFEETKIEFGSTNDQTFGLADIKVTETSWIVPLVYSIGAIIAMGLLFVFFRWLMGEKLKHKNQTGIIETREYLSDIKGKRTAFSLKSPKNARETVRFYYGKYLLRLQHKRVDLVPQDTAEDINNKYCDLQTVNSVMKKEASEQLLQIYRKARYKMTEQITKEEAEEAKQLYKTLR